MKQDKILLAHGSGGTMMRKLVEEVFIPDFDDEILLPLTPQLFIVSAGGGKPVPLILKTKGAPIAEDAARVLAEAGIELDPGRELHIEDIQNNPTLAEGLGELTVALNSGRITLAEVVLTLISPRTG